MEPILAHVVREESVLSDLDLRTRAPIAARAYANYTSLINRAVNVFGDEIAASTWLSTPNADLGGKVPLQLAQEKDYDPAVLESIFVRIEHGIYF